MDQEDLEQGPLADYNQSGPEGEPADQPIEGRAEEARDSCAPADRVDQPPSPSLVLFAATAESGSDGLPSEPGTDDAPDPGSSAEGAGSLPEIRSEACLEDANDVIEPEQAVTDPDAALRAALSAALAARKEEEEPDEPDWDDLEDDGHEALWASLADDPAEPYSAEGSGEPEFGTDHDLIGWAHDEASPAPWPAPASWDEVPPYPQRRDDPITGPRHSVPCSPNDDTPTRIVPESSPYPDDSAASGYSGQLVCAGRNGSFEIRHLSPQEEAGNLRVTYGFVVRNTAPVTLANVRVEHTFPEGTRCIGISPAPEFHSDRVVWNLGDVQPGEERRFLVRVEKKPGVELPRDTTAILHACYHLKTTLSLPQLEMAVAAPTTVKRGDAVAFEIDLKNTGTAPAQAVVVSAVLPAGLQSLDGEKKVEAELGSVAPGATVRITLKVNATQAGAQQILIEAVGQNARVSARGAVEVTEAALAVKADDPVRCEVDRPGEYRIEVVNPGTASIAQALLVNSLPEGVEFLGTNGGGEFDLSDRSITWVLGELRPGQVHAFTVRFKAILPGDLIHRLVAWSDCGLESVAEAAIHSEIRANEASRLLDDLLAKIDQEESVDRDIPALAAHQLAAGSPSASRGRQFVIFTVGDTDYAVPIENVLEYGHTLAITPVPNVSDWLLGVANMHGDIISMVDLRMFLGVLAGPSEQEGRMLVVRARPEELTVGFIVDRVKGLRVLAEDRISLPASHREDRLAPYLRGVVEHQGRLLVLLNLDQLLLSDEMRQFEPV